MHGRTEQLAAITGALAVAGVAAAVAQAAQVRVIITPNGPGEGEGLYDVTGGKIKPAPVNGFITAPSTFKCNASNLIVKATSIPLTRGKLNFSGKAYVDKSRNRTLVGALTWKGTPTRGTIRFVSPKTPKPPTGPGGSYTYTNRRCDTGTLKYGPRAG
jgi:hypothetical protein